MLNIGESNKHSLKQWNKAKLLSEDNPGFVSRDTYGPRGKAKLPVTLAKPCLLAFSAFLVGCSHLCLSVPKTCAWPSTSNTDCQPLRLCPHVNLPSGSNYKPNTQTPNNTKNSQSREGTFRENSLGDMVSIHSSKNFVEVRSVTLCILDGFQPRRSWTWPCWHGFCQGTQLTIFHENSHVTLSCKIRQKELVFKELLWRPSIHRKSYGFILSLFTLAIRRLRYLQSSITG